VDEEKEARVLARLVVGTVDCCAQAETPWGARGFILNHSRGFLSTFGKIRSCAVALFDASACRGSQAPVERDLASSVSSESPGRGRKANHKAV
jgi:hypothetical protein